MQKNRCWNGATVRPAWIGRAAQRIAAKLRCPNRSRRRLSVASIQKRPDLVSAQRRQLERLVGAWLWEALKQHDRTTLPTPPGTRHQRSSASPALGEPAFPNPRRMPPTLVCVRVPPRLSNPRRAPPPSKPLSIGSIVRDSARAAGDTEKDQERASATGCVRPNGRV